MASAFISGQFDQHLEQNGTVTRKEVSCQGLDKLLMVFDKTWQLAFGTWEFVFGSWQVRIGICK